MKKIEKQRIYLDCNVNVKTFGFIEDFMIEKIVLLKQRWMLLLTQQKKRKYEDH